MTFEEARLNRIIEHLRNKIEQLEMDISALRGEARSFESDFDLTVAEAAILRLLVARGFCTSGGMLAVTRRDNGEDLRDWRITRVWISKLRKKLAPHGLEIETVWGEGYRLPNDTRARLKDWDAKERAA